MPRKLRERVTPAQQVGMRLIVAGQTEGLIRAMPAHLGLALASGMVAAVVGAAGSGKYKFRKAELDIVVDASWRAQATDADLRTGK